MTNTLGHPTQPTHLSKKAHMTKRCHDFQEGCRKDENIPGNFFGFLKGTNFAPIAKAIGGPNINPRASIPRDIETIKLRSSQPKDDKEINVCKIHTTAGLIIIVWEYNMTKGYSIRPLKDKQHIKRNASD